MDKLPKILLLILNIAYGIVLVHVIMSWLINFQVLNLRQPLVAQVWSGLNNTLEPVYRRIRKMIPISGGIDFAPLIVFFGITALRIVVSRYSH